MTDKAYVVTVDGKMDSWFQTKQDANYHRDRLLSENPFSIVLVIETNPV